MSDLRSGALAHYVGEAGQGYFEWQNRLGRSAGAWNAPFFAPHILPTHSVLDFGCGAGHLLAALPGGRKVGVEVNPAARAAGAPYGFPLVADLAELGDEQFDVVVSSHALEHVPAPYDALRELRNRLAPDGFLLLLLPLDDWRVRAQRNPAGPDVNMHLYCWTPRALANLLVASGFSPRAVRVVTRAFPPLAARLWRLGRPGFELAAFVQAVVRRQRQLFALAVPSASWP